MGSTSFAERMSPRHVLCSRTAVLKQKKEPGFGRGLFQQRQVRGGGRTLRLCLGFTYARMGPAPKYNAGESIERRWQLLRCARLQWTLNSPLRKAMCSAGLTRWMSAGACEIGPYSGKPAGVQAARK